MGLEPARDVAQERGELDRLDAWLLLSGVRARQRQHRAGESRQPAGLALDVAEETVALGGILLGAGLEHLDGADDRRERCAELVRRVRDELALGELSPLLLGQVVDDEQRPVGVRLGGDADQAVRMLLVRCHVHLRDRGPLVKQSLGELAQSEGLPGLRQRVSLAEAPAEDPARLGVREVHDEVLVDRQDSFLEPLEQDLEAVALGLDAAERAAQLAAHAVEALDEQAELVAEVVAERRLEVAVGEGLGGRAEPAQPQGDQLREQEADDDADHARDHARAERLAVDRVDRLGGGGLLADRHEHRAVVRDRRDVHASVRRPLDEVFAAQRCRDRVALEARGLGRGAGRPEEVETGASLQLARHAVESRRRDVPP